MRLLPPILLALLTAAIPPAAAHADHTVGGRYVLTVGWETEPPVVDQPNAVWLRVQGPPPMLDSGPLAPGATYAFTFGSPGKVAYHCHPHPWMRGNVTIEAAGHHAQTHHVEVLDGAGPGDFRFVPENLTVRAGDTVVWHNNGTMTHEIMDDAAMREDDAHGHDHGGEAHDHGELVPVRDVEQTLKVDLTIGGKTRTFDLRHVHGQPGVYVARFLPSVPGIYTATFHGTVEGVPVEVTQELQRVEALADATWPEPTDSAYRLQQRVAALEQKVAALEAQLEAKANTPADVDTRTNVPGFGLAALALAVLAASFVLRKRT